MKNSSGNLSFSKKTRTKLLGTQSFSINTLVLSLLFFHACPSFVYAQTITGAESVLGVSNFQTTNHSSFSNQNTSFSFSTYDKPFHLTDRTFQNSSHNISFAYTQSNGNGFYHMSFLSWQDDIHGSFGVSYDDFNFSTYYGDSEGIVTTRQNINGISPNFFHGAVSYSYEYGGATLEHSWSEDLKVHGGAMFIEATGLEDRSVYFGGFNYKNLSTTIASVSRGEETVGYSFIAGWTLDEFEVGYQEIDSKYNSNWREFSVAFKGDDSLGSLQLNLGTGTNDLYEGGEESRVTLSYSISLGGNKSKGSTRTNSTRKNSSISYAAQSFQTLSKSSFQAVGSGLVLSSGDPTLDRAPRFYSQDRAGYFILSRWNPISVSNNREYGSAIYQNRDGTFAPSSIVIPGTIDSVSFNPYSLVPYGTKATADWHTHGADIPGYASEQFSRADIMFSNYYHLDGYLGTPQGRMFLYDIDTATIYQFIADGNEFVLPH